MSRRIQPIWSLTVAAFLITCLAGCGDDATGPASEEQGSTRADIRFTDVSASSGVTHANVSGESKQKLAIVENIGQGAGALDYDGDGDLDLFICNGDMFSGQAPKTDPRCALYRNDGEFKFTDVTEEAGLVFKGWVHGASVVDFDADGHQDLYLACYLRDNIFFRNTGKGGFEDATETWGGGDPSASTTSAFFDADNDGDLDLYVGNYVNYDPKNPPNSGKYCEWKNLKVSCGPNGTEAMADVFYENVDGRLVEATAKFGFDAAPAYTLGLVTCDFDNDGDLDLYVANDSVGNYLFENLGDGKYQEAAWRYAVDMQEDGRAQAGMGVDAGDVDNDGRFEFFVTNFSHDYNTLYKNGQTPNGKTHFTDSTYAMKLGESSFNYLSWGTRIHDLDLDGWQDIVVASGHVYPQVDGANLDTSYAQLNQIFVNDGARDGQVAFTLLDNSKISGWDKAAVSRGLVTADLDDDGDQDMLIVELDTPPTLLRNDTTGKGSWIGFHLIGKGKNRDAIGTRIEVVDSAGVSRWRDRAAGASFLSSSDPRVVFGLGAASGPVTAKIRWPDGTTKSLPDLATGKYHVITE